jgi:hypothetical protein
MRLAAAGLAILAALASHAAGQTPETAGEFWPAADIHAQFRDNLRLEGFGGLKKGEDFSYQQADVGVGLGYQWKRFTGPHLENIDPDKESFLVAGVGYEYIRTIQPGKDQDEDRIAIQVTPRFRPPADFLLTDRNRVEFRWVNGDYSTRYRNQLTVERGFFVHEFRLDPYASAEFFYDISKSSWSEERYSAGIQLPYRHLLMVDLYYLRQNCPTCSPEHLNVLGLTVNVYFGNGK